MDQLLALYGGFEGSIIVMWTGIIWCLFIAYRGVPMWTWALTAMVGMWGYAVPATIQYWILAGLVLVTIKPIRQNILSRVVMALIIAIKLFPKVSETERVALEAGTVWVDAELFSGNPNLKTLMSQSYPLLTAEEQSFLDGPVDRLCDMVNDWEVTQKRGFSQEAWAYMKQERFFGMIIPKKYGGLEMSALAHSAVIAKLSSRSSALGITIMVPNSLGPAELLNHYGTQDQKTHYLPRLASGEEIPCFGLTEPKAGSDAGAIQADGVVIKGDDGELYLKLNFTKRYITLAGISTVIGLAFQLHDPNNLLGKGVAPGITCALIPSDTPGVDISRRHDPMGVPFYNCPVIGIDVVVPVSTIIGGPEKAGEGWKMLMESLAAGRGISLPANCTGGAKMVSRVTSAHSTIRKQFGMSIGKFEGIEEVLARIGGQTYLLDAARIYTCGAIDSGAKPSVVTAMVKYHFTETFRQMINDGMDVLGGNGISNGPRNMFANPYKAVPIGITVEGANILTRTMIIFGQGVLRCHPYAYEEIKASNNGDLKAFDRAFFGHVHHVLTNIVRAKVLTLTQGLHIPLIGKRESKRYFQKLVWVSAVFSIYSDLAMVIFGGALKRKERITGRLGDVLSWMYLITSVLRRYEAEGQRPEDRPFMHWACQYGFYQIQLALEGLLRNMPLPIRLSGIWLRLIPVGRLSSDKLGSKISNAIQNPGEQRDRFTEGLYIPRDPSEALGELEDAFDAVTATVPLVKKVQSAIRAKTLPKKPVELLVDEAVSKGVLTSEEGNKLRDAEAKRLDAIQVDSFDATEYRAYGFPETKATVTG